jgi:hypothetical protein
MCYLTCCLVNWVPSINQKKRRGLRRRTNFLQLVENKENKSLAILAKLGYSASSVGASA